LQLVVSNEELNETRQVWFIHGARNGSAHAFRHEVRDIAARHPWLNLHVRYSQPRHNDIELRDYDSVGHVDIGLVDELIPTDEFDYYLCGPGSFVESLCVGLKEAGVQDKRIHYEYFSAGRTLSSPMPTRTNAITAGSVSAVPVRVHFAKSAVTADWDNSKGTLLDLAESIGLRPPYSCRSGICQTCLTPVLAGEVAYVETPGIVPDAGQALICCAYPLGQDLNCEFVIDL
jgi:ferredoxin